MLPGVDDEGCQSSHPAVEMHGEQCHRELRIRRQLERIDQSVGANVDEVRHQIGFVYGYIRRRRRVGGHEHAPAAREVAQEKPDRVGA